MRTSNEEVQMLVESRADLLLAPLVDSFLGHTDEEDPRLSRELRRLDSEGRTNLGGILGRFDERRSGDLDARGRLLARRVLGRLKRPATEALVLTNKILDYLDLNADSFLTEKEVGLCVEIFEMFSSLEAPHDSLSVKELRALYAVLRHLDADHDHALSHAERRRLRAALEEPARFLEAQKRENPLLRKLLEG